MSYEFLGVGVDCHTYYSDDTNVDYNSPFVTTALWAIAAGRYCSISIVEAAAALPQGLSFPLPLPYECSPLATRHPPLWLVYTPQLIEEL